MKKILAPYIYIFLLTLFSFVLVSCSGGSSGGGTYSIAPTAIPPGENSGYGSGPDSGVWYAAYDISPGNYVSSLKYSPDGTKLAVGTWGGIDIYDVSNGYAHLKKITVTSSKITGNRVKGLAFNPNGTKLVSILYDGNMQVWNTSNYSLESTVSAHSYDAYSVDFTSNGEKALTFGANGIGRDDRVSKVWDMTVSPPTVLATVSNGVITSLLKSSAISPDGNYLAQGGYDKLSIIDISDPSSPSNIISGYTVSGNGAFIGSITFHPDGKTLVVGQAGLLHYFNLTALPAITKTKTSNNGGYALDLSYSTDGSVLAVAGGIASTAMIWNGDTKKIVDGNEYAFICASPQWVTQITTKPDGAEFAFDVNKRFQVWKKYEY